MVLLTLKVQGYTLVIFHGGILTWMQKQGYIQKIFTTGYCALVGVVGYKLSKPPPSLQKVQKCKVQKQNA